MINSMTGYGRGSSTRDGFTFSAELRSVNHRYADLSIRLPRELYFLEDGIRRLLLESIRRGRVEVNLVLDEMPAGMRQVNVNYDLAEDYFQSLKKLTDRLGLAEEVKLKHILQMPELFKPGGFSLTEEQVWPAVGEALHAALEHLMEQRRVEGENLCRDLLRRCDHLEEMVGTATLRAEEAKDECRNRTEQKLKELLTGQFEETRLLMECAILVERMGIDEELVRLQSHINAFRKAFDSTEPVGRKLDFIAQEMFREINTIGSKAGDYQLTNLVVDLKAELEKIREQIQNLE
ncbi:MAG: YicC/YloC family endoribonuclease [Bacillota bacterium]|nr:YicC/YloC family endoribonuclease [Bacillota bacterium]